jgi:hypothetical protein
MDLCQIEIYDLVLLNFLAMMILDLLDCTGYEHAHNNFNQELFHRYCFAAPLFVSLSLKL